MTFPPIFPAGTAAGSDEPMSGEIRNSVDTAETFAELAVIRRRADTLVRPLPVEAGNVSAAMETLSSLHHRIIKRTFELCLREAIDEGATPPKVRYCFLVMGSGGRREMLLAPDQDHALIFEDVADERVAQIEAFFGPLGERLGAALERVGYPSCRGGIMAGNPAWRGRISDWRTRIADWVNNPEPRKIRYSSIFFDFAPLAGDPGLAESLRGIVRGLIRDFPRFLYHVMALDSRYKVPIDLLGRFVLDKRGKHQGELSLKQGGSVYIVDCIRMFALERELDEATTLGRLAALVRGDIFDAQTANRIRAAFETLTFLRLRNEVGLLDQGKEPSAYLAPGSLSGEERYRLRKALHAVSKLQRIAGRHFGRLPF